MIIKATSNASILVLSIAENTYISIQTSNNPTGEIRGQLSLQNLVVDGITYGPLELRDYRFEGVRSASITNSYVNGITLIELSVNLYSSRSDNAIGNNIIDVDASSSLVSYEHRQNHQVSENIFVQSISYNGTGDVGNAPWQPTSVWGPLRSMLVKKVYQTLPYNVKYGSLLDSTSPIAFGTVSSTPVTGGVLGTRCAKLFIPASITASLDLGFSLVADKYYLWSIHALKDSPDISGNLGIPGDAQLGQVILKQAQWACSYGIKKFSFTTPPTDTVHLSIHNSAGTQGIIYLADVQVVEFDNLSDAISYAQSRAFITTRSEKILGPVHTSSSASAYFRWIAEEDSFEIENAFNIAEIVRIDVGVYNVLFEIALDELPVVQLTPETLEGGGEVDTAVVTSFEELSVAGFTVRLVEIIDGVPTPVDDSFALTVA
ncbi:MAG TPA: hypothetical protein PL009_12590 [Flavipsychrobacter sp.]|nr:hypothetical protein [Flavipsychrobacter sp.]